MILVTGGTGFLGAQLTFDLVNAGNRVRIPVRNHSKKRNLEFVFNNKEDWSSMIDFVEADLSDMQSVQELVDGCDQIYHCAAQVSFLPSQAQSMIQANEEITANLVNALLGQENVRLCHVSSVAALGRNGSGETIDENSIWNNAGHNSNYAKSKYAAEREIWRGIAEGLNAFIINPSIILGPGHYKSIGMSFQRQVWNGLAFYTKGANSFCDVRDVSKAMISLMSQSNINGRYIIASANATYQDLFNTIAQELNKKKAAIFIPPILNPFIVSIEKIRTSISGTKPLITKETARTASEKYYYKNDKIKSAVDFDFLPLQKTLQESCKSFLNQMSAIV
ncbi:MAG TPA: NAD-dependent epimerase/dehydratase family protein [Bacteroidia bacterium]|nr:NAD-dependent epimerase/dehydratase family protein [Bacteroidia bacterium]HNT79438.1 NAD-dependent epimerase/dehydratase family protein [Bacteroidia bacterium]